jgi:hypothetical protein
MKKKKLQTPEDYEAFFKKAAERAGVARWAGHQKQTEEERKAKRADYARKWRAKNKKEGNQ